ncbi:MAG: alpha/beta hydrolase [SAR324 cluster bacterium]|nr:alpha/beta hydrolase [SAR324 cluster bacterium]
MAASRYGGMQLLCRKPHRTVTPARIGIWLCFLLAVPWLGGCNSFFFQPDNFLYYTPDEFNLTYEEVVFRGPEGNRITGWFLPAREPVQGTIIHFHGNAANITNHVYAVRWLPPLGYSVLLFDYRGYGVSEGTASRSGAIADGAAAINYVRGRKDVDPTRLIVYGQSLGGALAVNALALAGGKGVRALIVEGGFASYREVVRLIMNDTWFLWPFQYPVAYGLFSDHMGPENGVPALTAVPLLVVHGEADQTVPFEAGKQLFDIYPGGDKTLWAIPKLRHMEIFGGKGSPWRKKLVAYMDGKMEAADKEKLEAGRKGMRRRSGPGWHLRVN